MSPRTPVVLVTGYLGSGKTTLIRRLLGQPGMGETAVIVNELGEIGIDHAILRRVDERTVLLASGCLCCTLRGDLADELRDLIDRRDAGEIPAFSRVVVETTGLADPAPVAQTFFADEDVKRATKLDAIVTVVDAKNLPARLADSKEAEEQIAFADIVLLNKMDLVSPEEAAEVERRIRAINPQVEIRRSTKSDVPLEAVLGRDAFNLARILEREPEFLSGEDDHEHDSEVQSMSFQVSRPIDPEKFNAWISGLLAQKGQDLLRTKGILHYRGDDRRFAFQAVHMMADGDFVGHWKEGDPRRSKIVFIGRDLNRPQLRRGFEACQVEETAAA